MKRILLGLAAALVFAAPAQADTYVVNSTADTPGTCATTCTLRQAITSSNGTPAVDDTITIPANTYNTTSVLELTDAVTITGAGPNQTIIAANATAARVLEINSADVSISDVGLQGGSAPLGQGGSLMAEGSTVVLTRLHVTGGSALSGGGIANRNGIMTINESLIDSNQATGIGAEGGGVVNVGDTGAASMTINNSTIAFNSAPLAGGLSSYGEAGLTTNGVTIAKNLAGAGGTGGVRIGAGTWNAKFTLVSSNFQDGQILTNCSGNDASSNGWNVEDLDQCGFRQEVDRYNVGDARVSTILEDNTGPTLTMKLLAGSPALSIRTVGCEPGIDQRVLPRPQGSGCDAGAYESDLSPGPPPTITSPPPVSYRNVREVPFTGTAQPGETVNVFLGFAIQQTTEANAQGVWTTEVELPDADGVYTYEARTATSTSGATVEITLDRVDPETTIATRPDSPSTSSTAAFTYSSNEAGTTFACRFFGPGHPTLTYSACPVDGSSYTGLAAGEYTFDVLATDRAGNTDENAASYTFTVDATPVVAPEVSEPTTEPTAATFTFSTAQSDRTFTCRLEGPGRDATFSACASPQRYDGLAAGAYRFTVRASDAAGNFADAPAREFALAEAPPVVVPQPVTTPAPTSTPTPRPTETPAPQPEVGESIVIRPTAGRVFIQLPGSSQFVELRSIGKLPLGSTIDVRGGRILLRFETEDGKVQSATFYGGIFQVRQVGKILDLKLTEPLAACPKKGGKTSAAQTKKVKKRKLWGDGKGAFRTSGKYSAATVRGTKWLVEDSCAGTLTRVANGVVAVRAGKKTVLVRAEKQYLAKPR